MKRIAVVLLLAVGAAPASARAQGSTQAALDSAISLYRELQIERARERFLRVISPSSPFEVSPAQRVTAYTYLGASLATLGQRDSAVTYFLAAIERDPFVDLDPQVFTEEERGVFAEAKRRSFRVGVRPIVGARIQPRVDQVTFSIVTSHAGSVEVEINSLVDSLRFVVWSGESEGLREVRWAGTLPRGGLIPAGSYELVVTGRSSSDRRQDSTRVYFDVVHDFPPLEDTLATLGPAQLLPERHPPSLRWRELLLGLGVAGAAVFTHQVLGDAGLGGAGLPPLLVASSGGAAGIISYVVRSRKPGIPGNVAANQARRRARDAENAAILGRNAQRIAQTQLVLTPAAGFVR